MEVFKMPCVYIDIVKDILHQVRRDERFFGEGFIESWNDFSAFRKAYENERWSSKQVETLKLAFLLMRLSGIEIGISSLSKILKEPI